MTNGNAHQSKWSQEFHASRGATDLPCPVAGQGRHAGTCKEAHPRGVVIHASGEWSAVRPVDYDSIPTIVEHYA